MKHPRGAVLAAASLTVLSLLGPVASAEASREQTLDLRFSEFFVNPIGPRGLALSQKLRAADGQRVRLIGYMVSQEQPEAGRFMLTPRPVQLSEHADGEADDLPPSVVLVLLDPSQRNRVVAHRPGLIALSGRLQVGRAEDASGRVSWIRVVLDCDAVGEQAVPSGDGPEH